MTVLRFFESIRFPSLTALMSLITKMGEESVFLLVAITLMWCVDKKKGFFVLYACLMGQTLNQFLKMTFRVERPWIKYPDFHPVASAVPAAKGYSFPSGHTQAATNTYGAIALAWHKKKGLAVSMWVLVGLIALSRMYLGVHYPTDVIGSFLVSLTVMLAVYFFFREEHYRFFRPFAILTVVGLTVYTVVRLNRGSDPFFADSLEYVFKIFGATVGFILSWYGDEKYLCYDVSGKFLFQLFKVVLGFAFLMGIRLGCKALFAAIGWNGVTAHFVRYFVMVVFAGIGWPFVFSKVGVLVNSKKKEC